jgi:L-lysine exporter family protein LysE/ArgO
MPIYLNGLLLGLSLITALGPQNIFLIRQGVMRRHAVLSAITCFFCDAILIIASVVGLRHLLEDHAAFRVGMTWFGALFLLYYGISALKQALSKHLPQVSQEQPRSSRWQIIMLALGFSLLNPHAIIDSLVLIGGGSGQYPGHEQAFLFGVLTSSLLWFAVLTLTAHYFSKTLSRPIVWRCVEGFGGMLMVFLSIKLACSQLGGGI